MNGMSESCRRTSKPVEVEMSVFTFRANAAPVVVGRALLSAGSGRVGDGREDEREDVE